jgi:uncharacterized protein (DUF983 family)
MPQPTTSAPGFLPRLGAILRLRCPRCRTGRVFRSLLRMNDPCPHCGLVFEREEGYFLGAMYVSYALGGVLVAAAYFAAAWLWPSLDALTLCLLLMAAYVPLMPVIYRYSRVIWLHIDRAVSPSDVDAGAYEKWREQGHGGAVSGDPLRRNGRPGASGTRPPRARSED